MTKREFLVSESFSVADIVAAYTLAWASEYELLTDCPRLHSYVDRMYKMPSAPPTSEEAYAALQATGGEEIDWLTL